MKNIKTIYLFAIATALVGCGSARLELGAEGGTNKRSKSLVSDRSSGTASRDNRCDASQKDREVSEYDTSGDQLADVRKVFLRIGDETQYRLIMICREADLNADGVKDVVRQYDDEGRPLREETDRDFDGKMDVVSFYQHGELLRKEIDTDANGIIDYKIFYEDNKPVRAERDLLNKSTSGIWRANRWEYYEDGKILRMGTDIDGDGRVDRWDRNEKLDQMAESSEESIEE
ncbi:MAG: hypothetical protein JXA30_21090 [Deltaproteobacteria bacterium]|nr:hypothetical protein [Deltaproteobacteria bacterium]